MITALVPTLDSNKVDTILSRKKDEEFGVEVKLPVKHVLSQELQVPCVLNLLLSCLLLFFFSTSCMDVLFLAAIF